MARYILINFLVVLTSLACSRHARWCYNEIDSDCPTYASRILSYRPQNVYTGIGFDFIRGHFGLVGYLNVYALDLPVERDGRTTTVTLWVDEISWCFRAYQMQGGMRLLLPCEAIEKIFSALQEGRKVFICMPGYSEEVRVDSQSLKLFSKIL